MAKISNEFSDNRFSIPTSKRKNSSKKESEEYSSKSKYLIPFYFIFLEKQVFFYNKQHHLFTFFIYILQSYSYSYGAFFCNLTIHKEHIKAVSPSEKQCNLTQKHLWIYDSNYAFYTKTDTFFPFFYISFSIFFFPLFYIL